MSGSDDKTIRLWDAETGAQSRGPLVGHQGWVRSVAFSRDGTRIVSGSSDNTIRWWDAETQTGKLPEENEGHLESTFSLAGKQSVEESANTIPLCKGNVDTQACSFFSKVGYSA